jgi:hypothetical protein
MVVPLCHLGDSPMHAEITNTTNPSVTLNPCRICTLGVETLNAKQDSKYTPAFVGLHQDEVCDLIYDSISLIQSNDKNIPSIFLW